MEGQHPFSKTARVYSVTHIHCHRGLDGDQLAATNNDTVGERSWDLTGCAGYLEGVSNRLLDEIHHLAEELDDEPSKELVMKIAGLIAVNQSILMLHLLNLRLHIKEHDLVVDKELYEISDYVSELLSIRLREAKNLRKIL